MSAPRRDLLALTGEAIVALANKGLFNSPLSKEKKPAHPLLIAPLIYDATRRAAWTRRRNRRGTRSD